LSDKKQHKIQMKNIEERLKHEFDQERKSTSLHHSVQLEHLQDRISIEKRKAAEEEKESCKIFFQRQVERGEMDYQAQKRTQVLNFQDERRELVDSFGTERRKLKVEFQEDFDKQKAQFELAFKNAQKDTTLERQKHAEEVHFHAYH